MKKSKKENVYSSPSKYFNRPMDVLHDQSFNLKEKYKVLKSWELSCIRMRESEYEGMRKTGEKDDQLIEVQNAIREVIRWSRHKKRNKPLWGSRFILEREETKCLLSGLSSVFKNSKRKKNEQNRLRSKQD